MVVEARTPQLGLGQVEPERADEVQFAARPGDHADRVSRVGWDAGLVEHHSEHGVQLARYGSPSAERIAPVEIVGGRGQHGFHDR